MGKYQEPGRSAQRSERITRRQLLAGAFATVGGLTATACRRSSLTAGQEAPPDPTKVQGLPPGDAGGRRSPFVRLTREAGWTFWSYTPLGNIDGIITPSDLHYEVHHAGAAVVDPNRWTLTIHGMVERPIVLNLDDLRKFPSLSRIVFLECSGNSPVSWRGAGSPQDTVQNLVGLTSCSLWTGVAVSTLLREVGVKAGAKWALAEGSDAAVMTRSIPIEKLMSDAMVAYGQNGEPLRIAQGFPARLLLPGWEGNTNIKWLRRLELADAPFMHKEETGSYTDPMPDGKVRQFTFVIEARSIITSPSGGQTLLSPGFCEIRGLAWSGRGRINRVEVSTDGGGAWLPATLDEPVLPMAHTRFRFPWKWDGREVVIESRAIDETGYVQPTRAQLVKVRGTGSIYHFNGIQPWRVTPDGKVTNAIA